MTLTIRSPATSQSEPSQTSLSDVTFDGKGHLYCSDQKANTIYRVDLATQTVSVLVTDRSLAGPSGLAIHPKSGQIIAVSWEKGKISEVSPEGVVTELFSNGFFSSRFQNLRGVDFDRWGNMYVSDFTTGKVWRMSWDKRFQVIAEFLPSPGDLSIDRANNLILVPYELAHAAEMNGLETPSGAKVQDKKNGHWQTMASSLLHRNRRRKGPKKNEPLRLLHTTERQAALPRLGGADLQPMLRRTPNRAGLMPRRLRLSRIRERLSAETTCGTIHAGAP